MGVRVEIVITAIYHVPLLGGCLRSFLGILIVQYSVDYILN
jgi:hypothetical protein